jgi:outer membrane protein, adhesin transport system
MLSTGLPAVAQIVVPLPLPVRDPLSIDSANDPILAIAKSSAPLETLRALVATAISHHPAIAEAVASRDEADAGRAEALAQRFGSVDLSISNFQTLSRAFSNDPQNIIERSRARTRTDATLTITQPVFDFGAQRNRILSARARLTAAEAGIDSTADQIAVRAIGAWYEVFAYRALVSLSSTFAENQRDLRLAVQVRIDQGVSARGDIAQVDSYIGSADRRVAEFTRALAGAEARFLELVGEAAPPAIMRAPTVSSGVMSKDLAIFGSRSTAPVIAAQAQADASRRDASAAKSALLPQVSVGIDAGRYGVFETERDYDIRARITLRQRFFGGTEENSEQVVARSRAAAARASRITEEAARDASIAWSDVNALETELAALEVSYLASRKSRDVLVERFRVSRGTLFDVLAAEDNLFQSAGAYIRSLTELDTARYTLLSRSGKLLEALQIDPAAGKTKR